MLAWTYWIDAQNRFSDNPKESISQAIEYAKRAETTNVPLPAIHSLWNTVYLYQKQYEKAVKEGQKAIKLGPNDSISHALLAGTMLYTGRFVEAITFSKQAIRLSPHCPAWFLLNLGQAYLQEGHYEDALSALDKALDRSLKGEIPVIWSYPPIIATYVRLNSINKAKAYAAKLINIDPNFSVGQFGFLHPYKDQKILKRYLDDLRKAGLN